MGQVTLSADSLKYNKADWFKLKPKKKSDDGDCGEIRLRIDVGSPEPVLDMDVPPPPTFKKADLEDNAILIENGHYYVKYGNQNDKTPKKYFNIQTKSRVYHIILKSANSKEYGTVETIGEDAFQKLLDYPTDNIYKKVELEESSDIKHAIFLQTKDIQNNSNPPCYIVNNIYSGNRNITIGKKLSIQQFDIESAIIVKLSHFNVRLFAVDNHKQIDSQYTSVSGAIITEFLKNILVENKRKISVINDKTIDDLGTSKKQFNKKF